MTEQHHITPKIKKELKTLGIRPNKRLGQNFLINTAVYKKIISALKINANDIAVEVGPGIGTLTKYLAETGAKIIAVEKDKKIALYLQKKFSNYKNVKITQGDILKFNPSAFLLKPGNYKLVGNIPYYLTSHLLRIAFESWPKPELIIFMMQKEVAEKITAKPPNMTLLGVAMQYYAEPSIIAKVSRGNFYPQPDVDSSIIRLKPHNKALKKEEIEKFFRVVRAGFSQKRKQLINTLPKAMNMGRKDIEKMLQECGINTKRRAETLTLKEWEKIAAYSA